MRPPHDDADAPRRRREGEQVKGIIGLLLWACIVRKEYDHKAEESFEVVCLCMKLFVVIHSFFAWD